MEVLTDDFVAIDTNVFGHITDGKLNSDRHIDRLLRTLFKMEAWLLVDDGGFIVDEYSHHILQKTDSLTPDQIRVLRFWMDSQQHKGVPVNKFSQIWNDICSIVPEETESDKDDVDRIFVYVAFVNDRILISNDEKDIIKKRDDLKLKATELGLSHADVMTSQEAYQKLEKH